MNVLVLGGTGLVGTAIVAAAIEHGHQVTLVHRGRTHASDMPDCEHVILDRVKGHAALAGTRWDAVIDVSGYLPAIVHNALEELATPTTRWVFISTTAVGADPSTDMQNEDTKLARFESQDLRDAALSDPNFNWQEHQSYGECKVLCEEIVRRASTASTAILRPCVVAGAHDATWRFSYWVDRARRGGVILAPGPPDAPVALIDARDIAAFALRCIETAVDGTYVLAPRPDVVTMEHVITSTRAAYPDVESSVVWADPELLREHGVVPWTGLPLWLPSWTGAQGFNAFDASSAYAHGFTPRPVVETARDVRAWFERNPSLPSADMALSASDERMIVAHIHAMSGGGA